MPVADPQSKFSIDPQTPPWVEARPDPVDPGGSGEPVHVLLADDQIDVASRSSYRRAVQRLNNPQGVQQVSQVEVNFDPASQDLTVHSIAVIRDGVRREVAGDRSAFRMIQRETNLERQIYDGSISAVMLVEDVRVGDILDVSHTVADHDAVFPDRFAALYPLAYPLAIDAVYLTVRGAPGVVVKATDESEIEHANESGTEVWRRSEQGVGALELDPVAPSWVIQVPHVQISDFRSWGEVSSMTAARWDEVINTSDDTPEMDALVASAGALAPEAKADAMIAFVQNEIRYLGLEGGISSMVPEAPARVFGRRFGDCKDMSLLLCHLLGRAGVAPCPVLVNDEFQTAVSSLQPSPRVFNHVITMYEIGDQTHFVDPTISSQGGATGRRFVPPYSVGLPIRATGGDLIAIEKPAGDAGELAVDEEFVIGKKGQATALSVVTTAKGFEADILRQALGTSGESGAEKGIESLYKDLYPGAARVGALESEDDRSNNVLVMREQFTIPDFVQRGQGGRKLYGVLAHHVTSRLVGCPDEKRALPLELPFPNRVRQTIKLRPPKNTAINAEKDRIAGPGFLFTFASKPDHGGLQLDYSYENTADEVPPGEYSDYMSKLERVANSTGYAIPVGGRTSPLALFVLFLLIGVSFGVVRSCMRSDGRASRSDRQPALELPGERALSYQPAARPRGAREFTGSDFPTLPTPPRGSDPLRPRTSPGRPAGLPWYLPTRPSPYRPATPGISPGPQIPSPNIPRPGR